MNDTHSQSGQRERSSLFADPGRIAPSIDKSWRDAFIIELRLIGVPGERIGDALVTAESHVLESGESAEEAFGDPTDYAREMATSGGKDVSDQRIGSGTVISVVLGLVGMLASARALTAWLEHDAVTITSGDLVGWGILLLLVATLVARSDSILRFVVQHRWMGIVAAPVLVAGTAGILVLFRQRLFDVQWPPVAVLAVASLAVSTWVAWRDATTDSDEIVAPGEPPSSSLIARAVSALLFPGLTALILLMTWALSRATSLG